MRLNPIVKREVRVQSRSMKICWGVFAYELILALVYFLAMIIIREENRYYNNNIYSTLVWLYPVLAVTQMIILALTVPVRTASAISGEKERQTFDIMMTTSMTPFAIIMGKVMTAIIQSMFFVIASMPIMALSFVIGGMAWSYLFWFFAVALLMSFFAASIGILCSSLCKKSVSAVIMSYGFYLIFFVVTALPILLAEYFWQYNYNGFVNYYTGFSSSGSYGNVIYSYKENLYLFLLVNPVMYLVEFFTQILVGESLVNEIPSTSGITQTVGPINYIATGNWWMILSTILFLAISFLFLWLAAKRINPVKRKAKKQALQRLARQSDQQAEFQRMTQQQAQAVLQVAQKIQEEKRQTRELEMRETAADTERT